MGIDVVEYSDEEKENNGGFFGEKIFYMRVQHEDGDVKTSKVSKMEDWGWLAREEMVEKVTAEKRDEAALFYKYMLWDIICEDATTRRTTRILIILLKVNNDFVF